MRVLVIGVEGQVARSLREKAANHPQLQVEFVGRPDVDLAQPDTAQAIILQRQPELVINAAAYTAVDRAESEVELALRVNADAAGEVASAADEVGAPVIQFSTDYVFDGRTDRPYEEAAPTGALNIYGRTKLAGEEQVRAANPNHLILRTSWVYSPFGQNFVKTMLGLARQRDEVRVVSDQFGCPTSALDVADAVLSCAGKVTDGHIYHLAARGHCSWADFASEIFRLSAGLGGPSAKVVPIRTADFPTAAERPRYSVLDSSRFERDFGFVMPDWRESLADVVQRLVESQ